MAGSARAPPFSLGGAPLVTLLARSPDRFTLDTRCPPVRLVLQRLQPRSSRGRTGTAASNREFDMKTTVARSLASVLRPVTFASFAVAASGGSSLAAAAAADDA